MLAAMCEVSRSLLTSSDLLWASLGFIGLSRTERRKSTECPKIGRAAKFSQPRFRRRMLAASPVHLHMPAMPHLIQDDHLDCNASACSNSNVANASNRDAEVKKRCLVRLSSWGGTHAYPRLGHVMLVTSKANCAVVLDPVLYPEDGQNMAQYADFFLCPAHMLDYVENPPGDVSECPWYFGKYKNSDPRQERRWRKILSITIGHTGNISSESSIASHIDRICAGDHTAQFISQYMSKRWALTHRWHRDAQSRKRAAASQS